NISKSLGLTAEFFSTPTSLLASFKEEDEDGKPCLSTESTHLMRLDPGSVNLRKLRDIDNIGDRVLSEELDLVTGKEQLNKIIKRSEFFPIALSVFCYAFLSANFSIWMGGNNFDIIASMIIGLIIALITNSKRTSSLNYIKEGFAALVATLLSYTLLFVSPNIHPPVIIFSSLIILLPGLSITIALAELATNNLTAGTGRMVGAIMILLKLAFGMYLGTSIVHLFIFPEAVELSSNFPFWLKYLLIPIASLAFTVKFKAYFQDSPWIVLSGIISVGSSSLIGFYATDLLGIFVAGVLTSMASNAYARSLKRPALVMLLPGIIFLVPGSMSFDGLNHIFEKDLLVGFDSVFNATKVAISLVTGLFFGNVFINPRRSI
ncbi:MAG: uncharacterized membrane protein YjjP (DUF1212 family), partial [Thermoproteota archaeon]